ncbi:hypothetical protein [Bacillus sp. FJAT-27251]|uniref:hypothetical protein n=1 Tax=Bacillus sp. FJAT-27251 TaxID=1684142 RepID=UPI0006A7BA82|nr:hypothetical protein [Bacillus sp. FJAT-27251]
MKVLSFILAASFLLFSSSCNTVGDYEELNIDNEIKQIVFFSDEKDYNHEVAYYDAIIELKHDFPNEISNMMVLSGDKADKYHKLFDVKESPAILVFFEDEVVLKIDGIVSKEKIIQPLAQALSDNIAQQGR